MPRSTSGSRNNITSARPTRGTVTPTPVIDPPAPPTNLIATAFSSSRIDLSWKDNSNDELQYRIERSANGTTGWTEIASGAANVTTYSDTNRTAATAYYYRVRAYNLAGDGVTTQYSAYSNTATATTQAAAAPQAPSAIPTSLTVTPGTDSTSPKMTLAWVAPTGPAVAHYRVERTYIAKTTANNVEMAGWRLVDRVVGTSYVDRSMEPGLLCRYRVRAVYTGGTITDPSTVTEATALAAVHASVPGNPTALVLGAISDTEVDLRAYLPDTLEDGCRFERSSNGGSTWTQLPVTPAGANWYRDTGLTANTTYKYRVFSFNEKGDCAVAASGTVTTLGAGQRLSPTGTNPRIFWDYEWHTRWQQAKADYESSPSSPINWAADLYRELKGKADLPVGQGYNRVGRYEAMMYQITGDTAYALKAWDTLANFKLSVASANDVSEMYPDLCIVAEWIYSGLTTSKKADMVAMLLAYADFVLSTDVMASGTVNNSDNSATTLFFKSNLTGRLDNFYRNNISVKFTSGVNNGLSRVIGNTSAGSLKYYTGTDGGFFPAAFPAAPAHGDTFTIGYLGYAASAKVNDSDLNCGAVLGTLIADLILAGMGSARGGTLATSIQSGPNGAIPIGGYSPAATPSFNSNRAGLTAAIIQSRGGVWIESSEYNLGTTNFMEAGTKALSDASSGAYYGKDAYRLWNEIAEHLVVNACPNIESSGGQYQWGDVDNYARTVNVPAYVQSVAAAAGASRGRPVAGYLMDLLYQMWYSGRLYAKEPYVRYFFWVDPYMTRTDYRTYSPTHYARGMGVMISKDAPTNTSSSLFGACANQATGVDHENYWMGDFQLFRKGEWPFYSPLGYGQGAPVNSERINGVLLAGLSPRCRCRGPIRQQFGTGYSYLAMDAAGQTQDQAFYQPPATFIHEYTRSMVYLPSTDRSSDTVVVVDRITAANPKLLSNYKRYPGFNTSGTVTTPVTTTSEDADRIANRATALVECIFHLPTGSPTLGSGYTQWTTPSGQIARVQHLLPTDVVRGSVLDENLSSVLYGGSSWQPNEKKYQIRLTPATPWPADSTPNNYLFMNVYQAWDSAAPTNTLVSSASGEAKGVLVQRTGHNDYLLMFGAQSTEPTLRAGFTVAFTAGSSTSKVLLFDLDPTKTWSYTVNGGGSTSLTVSSQGVAEITLSGSGSKTLVFSAS